MDNKLSTSGGDKVHLLKTTHLDAGGFSGKANDVGDDSVGSRKVDNKFVVFDGTVVMSQLKENGSNLVQGVTINDIALVVEIVEKRAKEEFHDRETEVFIGLKEFLEIRNGGSINFNGSEGLKIVVVAMVGDGVDDRKSKKGSKKIDGVFAFGGNGVGTGKTGFIKENVS